MKKLFALGSMVLFASMVCFGSVTLTVGTPYNGQSLTSPLPVKASATSTAGITGWHIYLDGADVYRAGAVSSLSASLNASVGSHRLVVRAWDSTGAYDTEYLTIYITSVTSSPSGLFPAIPSTARMFSNIDDMSGWTSCHDSGCAGGSGSGTYWMSGWQQPSRDGGSVEFYNSGIWANALWWKKFGSSYAYTTNFLWDHWVYLDNASWNAAQTLEYDAFTFVNGYNYMMGTQCNYAARVWDVWDQLNGHWNHTAVPCTKFAPNTWHHIRLYTQRWSGNRYHYVALEVDGVQYSLQGYTFYAKYLGWGTNIGVQYQLDVNASGAGYHQWVDKSTFSVW